MPQIKSAKKALKQAKKKTISNLKVKKHLKSTIKKTEDALKDGKEDMTELLKNSQKALDKAAKKGIIKKKNAARKISRLSQAAKKAVKK